MTMTAVSFGSYPMVSAKCPAEGCDRYADHIQCRLGDGYLMSHDYPRTTSSWWPPKGHIWIVEVPPA